MMHQVHSLAVNKIKIYENIHNTTSRKDSKLKQIIYNIN